MGGREFYVRVGRCVVAGLCGYELAALPGWSPLPTLTRTAHGHRDTWEGKLVIAVMLGWITYHLFLEPSCDEQGFVHHFVHSLK